MKIKNIILTCIVLTLALLMFSTNSLATENITFTDSVFKEQVLYHGMTADFSVADQNSDGEISVEEAEQISIIDISLIVSNFPSTDISSNFGLL